MLDLGWSELLVIGVVALIVVGPKDLPHLFRAAGRFVGKARRMAREFTQAMNDAADDSGVGDIQRTIGSVSNPIKAAADEVRKSTESFTSRTMAGLDPERAEYAERIRERAAEMARESRRPDEGADDDMSGGALARASGGGASADDEREGAGEAAESAEAPKPKVAGASGPPRPAGSSKGKGAAKPADSEAAAQAGGDGGE